MGIVSATTQTVNNETLDFYSEGATLSKFIQEGRPTTTKPTLAALPSLTSHSTFYECSRGIPCQPQDSPHRPLTRLGVIISYSLCLEKDHITIDIHYSLEHHNRIQTKEVDLLDLKEFNDLPSWYPIFHLPYQIDVKVTCTGFHVYMEIIYIDSSPDPEIVSPYVYSEPSDEPTWRLYGLPSNENYVSAHGRHDRHESSISSQSVEYFMRYRHQRAT